MYVPTLLSEGHLNETTDYSPSLYNISASFNSFCVIRFLSATVPADLFHVSIKFELLGCSTMVKHHVCLYLCCSSYCWLCLVFLIWNIPVLKKRLSQKVDSFPATPCEMFSFNMCNCQPADNVSVFILTFGKFEKCAKSI